MKKMTIFIVILFCLAIIMFVDRINADNVVPSKEKALQLGEEKYLMFLWMIDGAFNSERLKEDFTVNGKKLSEKNKVFTCKYKNKKDSECIGNNFKSEFKKLFSSHIDYESVYSDKKIYSWISFNKGNYYFNNLTTCNINRMNTNQQLKVKNINGTKITYEVLFENNQISQVIKREFVLVLEDNEWKIGRAFYYDLCGMRYTIN